MITAEPGAVIARRYTLTRLLERGGMGSVWLARHCDLDIEVAVKFMTPALVASADARARFEREAKVAAPLGSKHVVQIHDYGVEDGTPYIIMEFLQGESLSALLARQKRLSMPVAARLLVQICKALRAAHEAGLVHRDLKPANIFLARKEEDEVVKVLDFGIAKSAVFGEASSETATGMMLGSAHYMSPEQIRSSKQVDHRSDLWSVGIMLYRMLTGRVPFPGVDLGDVLVRVCTDACPPASSIAPELPAAIDGFFERALARAPEQRFQSAMDLSAAFDAVALPSRAPVSAPVVRWNKTLPMHRPIPAQAVCVNDGPRDSAPTEAWQPRSSAEAIGTAPQASIAAASQPIDANAPTTDALLAREVNPASISAVLVLGGRGESSARILQPLRDEKRTAGRSSRTVAAMAAAIMLAGIVGAATLRWGRLPSGPASTTDSTSMLPSGIAPTPIAWPTIPSAPIPPSPSPPPHIAIAVVPSASVSVPAPTPTQSIGPMEPGPSAPATPIQTAPRPSVSAPPTPPPSAVPVLDTAKKPANPLDDPH